MDRTKLTEYIKGATRYPMADMEQLVSMVILHFDIPDKIAKSETWEVILSIVEGERHIRELLWAGHPCIGKYGDDGALQCNRFFGKGDPIDLKRDSWHDIVVGIGKHTKQLIEEAKEQVAFDLFEEMICPMCYRLNPQHATQDNGEGCHSCKEREDWHALKRD